MFVLWFVMNIVRFTAMLVQHISTLKAMLKSLWLQHKSVLLRRKKSESVFIIVKQPCLVIEVDLERGEAHRNKHFSEYSLADIVHFVNCGYHHHWFLTFVHLWLLSFCFLWDKFCLLLHVGNVCPSAYTFTVDFVACLCQIRSLCFIGRWHFKWPTVPVLFANFFFF